MENNNMGREYDWNDTIENDSEFVLLPEGDYNFLVKGFERARHQGSEKLPPCNKAVVSIEVSDAKGHRATIQHNLFLHSSCEGMLCEFFTGIGARKHGEKLRMDWNRVVGSRGRCKVTIREWTSNKTGEKMQGNQIRRFYDPATQGSVASAQPAAQQTSFTPGSF